MWNFGEKMVEKCEIMRCKRWNFVIYYFRVDIGG